MKSKSLLVSCFVVLAVLVAACASPSPTTAPEAPVVDITPTQTAAVMDRASLESALTTAGATVETGGPIEQPFFSVVGQTLKVNGADVQIFEYETAEAMEADAAQVAPDGGSVGTSMMNWMATPHFFKMGRILALYVGDDQAVLDLLKGVFGSQFAGR